MSQRSRRKDSSLSEQAQATLEYILMLSFAVALFMIIFRGVLAPVFVKARTGLETKIDQMFQGDNLHRLSIGVGR